MKTIKKIEIKKIPTITAQWAILCLGISVDKNTNQLSLFNIIEDVTLISGQSIAMNFVVKLERSDLFDSESFVKLEIIDPDKNKTQKLEDLLMFGKDKKYVRMISTFGATFLKSGEYDYVISVKMSKDDEYKEIIRNKLNVSVKDKLNS